jgi:hypothetical protein
MFWILPALLVLAGVFGAFDLITIDRGGFISPNVLAGSWLYMEARPERVRCSAWWRRRPSASLERFFR